jgi:cell division septation protein DedD
MRENNKVSGRFELSLDVKKVAVVLAGSLVLIGAAFALGSSYGSKAVHAPAASGAKDPLARLDEPLAAPPRDEVALGAHEALTASRADSLPVVKPVAETPTPPAADPLAAAAPTLGVNLTPTPTSTSTSTPTATSTRTPGPTPRPAATPSVRPERSAAKAKGELARAPKGKPAVVAAARHGYTIQVASVAHKADAEKVARRYQARHSRVVAADVPGKGRMWRVQVGSYPTRDAASRSLAALGAHGYITAMR